MSRGITDLGGIGRLLGECRRLAMELIRHYAERKNRELKNAEQALKNDALRLKNQAAELKNQTTALQLLERISTTAKKRGWSADETQEFITRLTCPKQIPPTYSEQEVQPSNPKLLGEYRDLNDL